MNAESYLEKLSRYERYITELENPLDIIEQADLKQGFIGTRRITDTKQKIKVYSNPLEEINMQGTKLYDTEIVKYYLLQSFPPKHGFRRKTFELMLESFSGIYAKPTTSENLILIDISSFYPSVIASAFGVKYDRHVVGYSPEYRYTPPPVASKTLRNSAYGLMRATHASFFTNRDKLTIKLVKIRNPLLYPDLCLLIYDLSQALCSIATREYNAIYAVIDGFIFPSEEPPAEFIKLLEDLGFAWKIKALGEGEVRCPYAWRIGERETIPYRMATPHEYSNLYFTLETAYEVIKKYKTLLQLKKKVLS